MKKYMRSLCAGLCCLAIFSSLMPVSAAPVHATAWLREVFVDGQKKNFSNAEGNTTYLFSCGGSIYMPANIAAQWLGCKLTVDEAGKTAAFTSGEAAQVPGPNSTPELTAEMGKRLDRYFEQGMDVQLLTDFTVLVDGKPWTFASGGTALYPFFVDGTLYLPLRAVGERMGKDVLWVPAPKANFRTEEVISIHAHPTQAQMSEMQSYLDQGVQLYWKAAAVAQELAAADSMTAAKAVEKLEQIKSLIHQIGNLSVPTHPYLNMFEIPAFAASPYLFNSINDAIQSLQSGTASFQDLRGKNLSNNLNATLQSCYRKLDEAQQALNALSAALGGV